MSNIFTKCYRNLLKIFEESSQFFRNFLKNQRRCEINWGEEWDRSQYNNSKKNYVLLLKRTQNLILWDKGEQTLKKCGK